MIQNEVEIAASTKYNGFRKPENWICYWIDRESNERGESLDLKNLNLIHKKRKMNESFYKIVTFTTRQTSKIFESGKQCKFHYGSY